MLHNMTMSPIVFHVAERLHLYLFSSHPSLYQLLNIVQTLLSNNSPRSSNHHIRFRSIDRSPTPSTITMELFDRDQKLYDWFRDEDFDFFPKLPIELRLRIWSVFIPIYVGFEFRYRSYRIASCSNIAHGKKIELTIKTGSFQ
jgi:hypothetical protein